jgi:uncharacterized Tic20 family protein
MARTIAVFPYSLKEDTMSSEEPISTDPKPGVPDIPSTPEERSNAMLAHILGAVIGFLGPLIFYITKKDSPFVLDQSKEALNFHLTVLIATLIIGVVTCGFGLIITVPVQMIFSILGGLAAQKGEVYRYPWKLELIK